MHKRYFRLLTGTSQICSAFAAGFGIAALFGWVAGLPRLSAFVEGKIPMAPSTALLFVLYGSAIFLHASMPENRYVRRAGLGFASLGSGLSLLLLILSFLGIHSRIEHLGIPIAGSVNGSPVGHMSPLTAFCFMLAGASFLGVTAHDPSQRRLGPAAFYTACLVVFAGLCLFMAYLIGKPLFYGTRLIPPALTTALAFLMLGTALMASSGQQAWPQKEAIGRKRTGTVYLLILIFIVAAAGISAAGYLYLRKYQHHCRTEAEKQLTAVARLKVNELVQWRNERMGDASVFWGNANFSGLVKHFLDNPKDEETRIRLTTWLSKVRKAYSYDRVFFLDARGVERLTSPDTSEPASGHLIREASAVLRSGRVAFLDFHREAPGESIHLAVLAPVFDTPGSGKSLGVLAFRIDPEQYLYPMIRRWPTASATAETLLIRRDGNDALFLNALRFKSDTALTLRSLLTNKNMPAVKAALGWEGFMEGIDYRGIPVAAAVCAVPDSPWRLVARMDLSEIYLPLRERLWMLGGLTGLMLIGAAAGVGMLWHRRNMEFFRERFTSEEALRKSEEQYHRILDTMIEGFQIIGYDWRYLYINDAAAAYGRQKKEALLGHRVMKIYPGFEKTPMFAELKRSMEGRTSCHIEEEFLFADGDRSWFELIVQPTDEGISILSVDISDRKQALRRVEHLNRVLHAIRNVNQLIVREKNRERLIQNACDMLVLDRGYISCLIVLTGKDGKPAIYAASGMNEGDFKHMAQILDRGDHPPCGEAVQKLQGLLLVSDRNEVCKTCPIARSCAGTDAMGINLIHEEEVFGYLVVAVEQGIRADEEEQSLFTEMAGDIAYALHTMMVQKNMEKSEQERKAVEGQFLQAQKMEAVGRLAGGVAHDFNNNLQAILGYSDLLITKLEQGHPAMGYIDEIQNAALRSSSLTRQLLAFARKETIAPEILDLNDTIESMLKMLRRLIGEDIDLLWKPAKNIRPIKMDPSQIDQILANLVVNARDAIAGVGKITIETGMAEFNEDYCANHAGFIPGRYALLVVSDNGSGMDRETLLHIFEPFFTTKTSGKGTGLGLSTVYGIAKQNNGFVNVYSEPGQGTTIRIYLPPSLSETAATDAVPVALELPTGDETILLVEDDLSLLDLGGIQLTYLGYRVISAETPERALRLAGEYSEKIHLLVTDVIMPEMSGRDLRDRINTLRPGIKCLFMSGYTADVITHHGVLEEGIHFLQKPFSRSTLARKIREALDV